MKSQKILSAIIISAIFFLMSSCTQDDSFESDLESNAKSFNITTNLNKKNVYTNYEATSNTTIDYANKTIDLEVPVPADDFTFLKTYNISTEKNTAILYLITRRSVESIVHLPANYLLNDRINLEELNIDLEKNNNISIFVMNNSRLLNENHYIIDCIKENLDKEADDTCVNQNKELDGPITSGGVIIF